MARNTRSVVRPARGKCRHEDAQVMVDAAWTLAKINGKGVSGVKTVAMRRDDKASVNTLCPGCGMFRSVANVCFCNDH